MSGRILVTPRSVTAAGPLDANPELRPLVDAGFDLVPGPIGRIPSEAELAAVLPEVDGWLAGIERITASVLEGSDRLRVIARNGTGTDTIDLDAARSRGVEVVTAPGANAQGVAELTLTLALAALRDVVRADRLMRAGEWPRAQGRELSDLRVGVMGYGAIGRRVARLFAAVGCEVVIFDPFVADVEHARAATPTELAAQVDVLTLHVPPPAGGGALVTTELLAAMPPESVLVNTARSALVDPEAVAHALDDGRLAAYAVDAFDSEPPELDRLLRHERTIMTPHVGGFTDASVRRATAAAVAGLLAALSS